MSCGRFHLAAVQWGDLGALPVAVALGAVLLAAVVWLYGSQVRAIGGWSGWVLPVLRGLAVVALVVAVLKPATVRPRESLEGTAVAVVVDRSASMAVADAGRAPAELVALADGLGLLDEGLRDARAAELATQVEALNRRVDDVVRAQSEVDYARLSGGGERRAREQLVAAEAELRRMAREAAETAAALPDAKDVATHVSALGEEVGTRDAKQVAEVRKRIETAARAAREHQSRVDGKLYETDARVRQVADALAGKSRWDLATRSMLEPGRGLLAKLPGELDVFGYTLGDAVQMVPLYANRTPVTSIDAAPSGPRSEIAGGVNAVLEKLRGADLRAIVLLSDGRQVGGEGRVVTGASGGDVPVFAVLAGPPRAARDVVVSRLDAPGSAHVGETMVVRADVRGRRVGNDEVPVRLRVGGQEQTKSVKLKDDAAATIVEFEVKLDQQAGARDVEVTAGPVAGEASTDNNSARRRVKVLGQKLRVAAYAGWGGWDFQYMRNALQRAPAVELKDAVLNGAPLPMEPDEILRQDVLVLCDVPAAAMSVGQRDAVHRLVNERGGSVILTTAGDATPMADWDADVLLSALLPWPAGQEPVWRVWPGASAGFGVKVAPTPRELDALRLNGGGSGDAWEQLPGVYRLLAMPQVRPNVRPLLVERETGLAVLTEGRVGAGRVMMLAINEGWRWRYKSGERYHERFWRQLVAYAAEPPYAVRGDGLALDAESLTVEPDQPIRVRAKRTDQPRATGELRVRLTAADRTVDEATMTPTGGGRYERVIANPGVGEYMLELVDPARGKEAVLWLGVGVTRTVEPELQDLTPDDGLMRRLAESSGGRVLGLEDARQLPAMINDVLAARPQTVQQTLWDSPYLFAFVLACLSAEWALRKRFGLV